MKDSLKTKQELIEELSVLKKKIKKLEKLEAECRQAQQVLSDSNYKFLNLAANVPGFIAYVNANTLQYEFVNDMFEKAFGIPREQIIGSHIRDVIGEDRYQFALKYIDEARLGKSVTYENTFDIFSGKRWIQVNYSPVMDTNGRVVSIAVLSYDITERKQAEESSIHESEEKFSKAFDRAPLLMTISSIEDGTYLDVNDKFTEVTGFKREEAVSKTSVELGWITPKDRERLIRELKKNGSVKGMELELEAKGGRKIFCQFHGEIINIGGKQRLLSIAQDISERKLTEEIVRKSEEKFSKAFHSSPILTAISTLEDGRFIDVNEIFLNKLLFSREEVVGKTSRELGFFANPAQRQAIKEMTERRGYAKNIEVQMVAKNGQIINGLFSTEPITINNEKCWLTVMIDVTEQKKAADALLESEEKHRIILEEASDPIFSFTPEGQYKYANKAFAKGVGKPVEDIIGKNIWDVFPKEEADKRVAALSHVFRTGEQKIIEVRVPLADCYRYYITTITPVKDTTGNVISAICSSKDITERKQAEERLRESEDRYRNIIENMLDIYYRSDREGRLIMVSPSGLALLGYDSEDDLIGKSISDTCYFDHKERDRMLSILRGKGSVRDFEVTLKHKDGTPIPVSTSSRYYYDAKGEILGIEGLFRDLRERKLAEDALRKSERQMADIIEFLPDATLAINREGRVIIWNKAIEEMTGVLAVEMIDKGDYAYTIPFYGEARPQLMDLVFDDHDEIAAKYPHVTREGRTLIAEVFCNALYNNRGAWVIAKASPLHDQSGNIVGAIESIRDITNRKQAEEKLLIQYRTFQQVLNGLNALVYVADMKTYEIVFINTYGQEIWGDITGKICWQAIQKDQTGPCQVCTNSQLIGSDGNPTEGVAWEFQNTIAKQWYDCRDKAIHWPDGRIVRMEIAIDITARKQMEEELRKSQEQLRDAHRLASIGIWKWTAETDTVTWTEELYNIAGLDPMLPAPTYAEQSNIYDPESWDRLKVAVEKTLETGASYQLELGLIRPDGATRWVNAFGGPTYDNHGRLTGLQGTLQDITDRKRAAEEKQSLQERLNRAEKMESLGLLAGGVAHDLNNVLGVVVGYAELILESADTASSIKPHLVNIMNGGQKAAAIVDDLLTLARRGVSGKEVLNLNEIIADCQQSPEFEKLYSYHPAVKINTNLEPDQPNITCSSVHLGKSLYNLVSNAYEAMPKGGLVTIKTTSQYLDKPIQGYNEIRSGDYVVLSVSDTGQGINNNDLKRIFEPFYTKKVMGRSGTGLGLAVVWGTVKDHHGYINVESEEGKGSTFTLYFPVTKEDITAEGVPASISEYMGKGEPILIVDDVKEQRDLPAGMLTTLNYNVTSVASGEEAVAYLKEHQADLIVLDMIMDPGMDGLDTYRSILEIRPQQRAIIVSGFSDSDRVHEAQELGAGAYVKKPYVKEKLGLAVRKELDRSA